MISGMSLSTSWGPPTVNALPGHGQGSLAGYGLQPAGKLAVAAAVAALGPPSAVTCMHRYC